MNLRCWRWVGCTLLLSGVLAGCAVDGARSSSTIGTEPYPPPGFPHRVASSNVELYWKCDQGEPAVMRLEGVARNPWSPQEVRFLEFDLVGIDQEGRSVSEGHGEAVSLLLGMNRMTRFQVSLRPSGREVRYDLFYQYHFDDMDIKALLAGPPMGRGQLASMRKQFLIRDACADTQHLVR
jgi:hypothetical protein